MASCWPICFEQLHFVGGERVVVRLAEVEHAVGAARGLERHAAHGAQPFDGHHRHRGLAELLHVVPVEDRGFAAAERDVTRRADRDQPAFLDQAVLGAEHEGVPAQPLFLLFPQPDAGEVVRNLLAEQLRNHFEQAAQVELGDHGGRDLEQQARAVARAAQALLAFAHRGVAPPACRARTTPFRRASSSRLRSSWRNGPSAEAGRASEVGDLQVAAHAVAGLEAGRHRPRRVDEAGRSYDRAAVADRRLRDSRETGTPAAAAPRSARAVRRR